MSVKSHNLNLQMGAHEPPRALLTCLVIVAWCVHSIAALIAHAIGEFPVLAAPSIRPVIKFQLGYSLLSFLWLVHDL